MTGRSSDCSPELTGHAPVGPSIWLARQPATHHHGPADWLLADETSRLASLSGTARVEFFHSRWLIRHAVAGASGHDPVLCAPHSGRPVRTAGPDHWPLSLSHSYGLAACATGGVVAIGVDLEPLTRRSNWQGIARRWFTENEQRWLTQQGEAKDFLRLWTLKEAWLKATGRGIAGNLKTLERHPDGLLIGELPGNRHSEHWHAWVTEREGFLLTVVCQFSTLAQVRPPRVHRLQCRKPAMDSAACAEMPCHQHWQLHLPIQIRSET